MVGIQVFGEHSVNHTPRFGFASRGANHVAPLRGAYAAWLTPGTVEHG